VLDGLDAQRDVSFARAMDAAFTSAAAGVLIENVHLLEESQILDLAALLRRGAPPTVVTAVSGPEWDAANTVLGPLVARQETTVPLRSRRAEIPALASRMLAATVPADTARFTPAALRALAGQPWRGNLAELRRVIDAVSDNHVRGEIGQADLPPAYRDSRRPLSARDEAEREVILTALRSVSGNRTRAAARLGVSRSTLYNRMRSLDIER
jgi:transcriptional regulator with AAA-type ATPase domain